MSERETGDSPSKPKHSGFLWKRGRVNTSWRKRWFLLQDGRMSYWNPNEIHVDDRRPLGSFSVTGLTANPLPFETGHAFQVFCL